MGNTVSEETAMQIWGNADACPNAIKTIQVQAGYDVADNRTVQD